MPEWFIASKLTGIPLMRPRNHRIDQLAALGKFVQRGVQFAQILTSEAATGCPRRWLSRCGRHGFRRR
jgi:hypothetical protein